MEHSTPHRHVYASSHYASGHIWSLRIGVHDMKCRGKMIGSHADLAAPDPDGWVMVDGDKGLRVRMRHLCRMRKVTTTTYMVSI